MATVEAFPPSVDLKCPPTENRLNVTAGEWCSMQFKITNKTEQPWDAEVINDFPNGQLKPTKISAPKRSITYLTVGIFIPRICGSQNLTIVFRLASRANNELIGDPMTAVLQIKESELTIDESDDEMIQDKVLSDQVIFSYAS